MPKVSQMGASKYEFAPDQFEVDIALNQKRFEAKKEEIRLQITKTLESEPTRMDETFSLYVEVLREMKEQQLGSGTYASSNEKTKI